MRVAFGHLRVGEAVRIADGINAPGTGIGETISQRDVEGGLRSVVRAQQDRAVGRAYLIDDVFAAALIQRRNLVAMVAEVRLGAFIAQAVDGQREDLLRRLLQPAIERVVEAGAQRVGGEQRRQQPQDDRRKRQRPDQSAREAWRFHGSERL